MVIMMVPGTKSRLLIKVDKLIWTSLLAEDQLFQRLLSVLVSFPLVMIKYPDRRQRMGQKRWILVYNLGYIPSLWGSKGKNFK